RVQALSVERGSIGRVVTLGHDAPHPPVVAAGPRGEAVVAWTDTTNRIHAATRGRTGAFRRAVQLRRPPLLLSDNPAVALGGDRHGSGTQTEVVLPRGATGASLVWLDMRPALPARLIGVDARTLVQPAVDAGTPASWSPSLSR